ncbi:MAG TPA: NlpC/P60 family protein [Actinocrinis sp.]|jgi:cell wall-associated NlpC family hydrolase|uniref:C40 family peptidase n=1 Tax=Actinocrinis sp. TaxID=1920516 RepID=UPI002DDD7437|nr:NlpC/P60 family protein [Actinocrinis sp.]HEV3171515.1 NlpC/P60 family protein [Actinocrinis sp.]
MASHRRPNAAVRAALTFTATGAAAATGVGLTATAGHAASVADVQAQVKLLDRQAEQATNDYDAGMEQMAALQKQVDQIQSEATTVQQSMNALVGVLGPQAAAQYRSGSIDPQLELVLSQSPDQYLQKAMAVNQLGQSEAVALKSLKTQQAQLKALQKDAADRLMQLQELQSQAAADRTQILDKDKQAQALLATLTFAQQQEIVPVSTSWGVTAQQIATLPTVTGRAGVAVAFAKSKLGIYYQWGGTGNPGYDCSGLTQSAWAAAGVSLGRTTYDQVTDGYEVAPILSNLQPGDLIFYDGNTHMAIYVGNGVVVHAPSTGSRIQYAPWNMLPIDAVRRVV